MCGILGYLSKTPLNDVPFAAALNCLSTRGPDAQNHLTLTAGDTEVRLGHTRLSILDVAGGAQPMQSPDQRYTLTYNGEIYNHQALRRDLESKGAAFQTSHSDTETLLQGLIHHQNDFVSRLNGMFSFGFYDHVAQRLILARDRFGIKPLVYYFDGETLAFASEVSALLQLPTLNIEVDESQINAFFAYDMVPAPNTIFKNVYKLAPGETLTFDLISRKVKTQSYYTYQRESQITDFEEALDLYDTTLHQAIKRHTLSDVPLTAFCSGGVDSTLMAAYLAQDNLLPEVFSVFKSGNTDEHKNIRAFSNLYDIPVRKIQAPTAHSLQDVFDTFGPVGEPYADMSLLPTSLISKAVYEAGYKVILSGDGPDEFTGGYPYFKSFYEGALHPKDKWFYKLIKGYQPDSMNAEKDEKAHEIFASGLREIEDSVRVFSTIEALPPPMTMNAGDTIFDTISQTKVPNYMGHLILPKVDFASMRHSLEVRVPFLDNEVAAASAKISPHVHMKFGGKGILKHLLKTKTHGKVNPFGRKRGFSIQYDGIFHSPQVWEYMNEISKTCPYVFDCAEQNYKAQLESKKITPKRLWRYLLFLVWWEKTGRHYG